MIRLSAALVAVAIGILIGGVVTSRLLLVYVAGQLVALEYVNPTTGASVLPTLGCAVHRVLPGGATAPVRRSGNAVYVVFRGEGSSVIAGQRFDWSPGDMFVVPSWAPVEHAAPEGADLFVLTDAPVLRALGIYREQTLPDPQPVTGVFTPR